MVVPIKLNDWSTVFLKIKHMNENNYNISGNTTETLLESIIDKKKLMNPNNIDNIMRILKKGLNASNVSALLEMILSANKFEPLAINDHVKIKPPNYHAGREFEWDVLIDKGLGTEDGYVFGVIKGDGSWSTDFDPYYNTMDILVWYYDLENAQIKTQEIKIDTFSIIKIEKDDIPYEVNKNKKVPELINIEL